MMNDGFMNAASIEAVNEALIASFVNRSGFTGLHEAVGAIHVRNDPPPGVRGSQAHNDTADPQVEHVLFDQVARLTRDVHDAIRGIARTGSGGSAPRSRARCSLEHVVTLTERAAHRTLDLVERAVPIVETIARDVRGASERALAGDALTCQAQVAVQLEQSALQAEQLQALLTDILLAQDFQDITGQIVRRVVDVLRDVETKLFGLVKVAASIQAMNGSAALDVQPPPCSAIEAEGPVIPGTDRRDVVQDQDEVDELLSKLGF